MATKWSNDALQELRLLRLIASGLDVRRNCHNGELRKRPTLRRVLDGIECLRVEVGWEEWDPGIPTKRRRRG